MREIKRCDARRLQWTTHSTLRYKVLSPNFVFILQSGLHSDGDAEELSPDLSIVSTLE